MYQHPEEQMMRVDILEGQSEEEEEESGRERTRVGETRGGGR